MCRMGMNSLKHLTNESKSESKLVILDCQGPDMIEQYVESNL